MPHLLRDLPHRCWMTLVLLVAGLNPSVFAQSKETVLYSSQGRGVSFSSPIVFPSAGSYPTGIAAGDFNNDGIADLIVGDVALTAASVSLGNGDGTFGGWDSGCGFDSVNVVGTARFDGRNLDALVNDIYDGLAQVCFGNGQGYFSGNGTFFVNPSTTVTAFAVDDFNRDANEDIAMTADEQGLPVGELLMFPGDGKGSFGTPTVLNTTANPVAAAAGDFNNDGAPDLVVLTDDVGDFGGDVAVFLGNGKGQFSHPKLFRIPKDHGKLGFSPLSTLVVGDFNGDHKLDVAVAISDWTSNATSYVIILLGHGDGTFRRGQIAPAGPNPITMAVADFNGDGIPDLAVGNIFRDAPGAVSVLIGKGDGAFYAPQTFLVNGEFPYMTVADFNNDGKPDIATANADSSSISILLNTTRWSEREAAKRP